MKAPIAIAFGDGIGPEIMAVVLEILKASGAEIELHPVEIGEKVYLRGVPNGLEPKTWEVLRHTKAFLKAPITTPQGGGYRSLNVTIRTTLGLYANVRPCVAYAPFIDTLHPEMDVVIVRENEEDLYLGIEYQQTPDICHARKFISRQGSEKIIRYAFEYAEANGRKRVTCFSKDNILKFSDGLFHKVFEEIAQEYSSILNEHWIVDIGAARLADSPEIFDVIVMPNLYGDILSDVAAQIAGSVGLAGSANIGDHGAMFEAIHGSAPKLANQNIANPSGLLLAAIQMLSHIDQPKVASLIHNAWLYTLEQGIHTQDMYKKGNSLKLVGTREFGTAVIQHLGKTPETLKPVAYRASIQKSIPLRHTSSSRSLIGVDAFLYHRGPLSDFFSKVSHINVAHLRLTMIANRGVPVWPVGQPETFCSEEWRLRFLSDSGLATSQRDVLQILQALDHMGLDLIRSEHLYLIDGNPGYSSANL